MEGFRGLGVGPLFSETPKWRVRGLGLGFGARAGQLCRNLIKKPWALIRVPYMNPTILGGIGPGFLNQAPTLNGAFLEDSPDTGHINLLNVLLQ